MEINLPGLVLLEQMLRERLTKLDEKPVQETGEEKAVLTQILDQVVQEIRIFPRYRQNYNLSLERKTGLC